MSVPGNTNVFLIANKIICGFVKPQSTLTIK